MSAIMAYSKSNAANFATFDQAKRYTENTGKGWTLEKVDCGIVIVTHHGGIVGKGLDHNTAIADAESNLGSLIHEFSLDLQFS